MNELDVLRTTEKDIGFHINRRMFFIINRKIIVVPKQCKLSHLEYALENGYIKDDNITDFLNNTIRGSHIKSNKEHRIYCYKGVGFYFDNDMIKEVIELLPKIIAKLNISKDTKVYWGPVHNDINGKRYINEYAGTIEELI